MTKLVALLFIFVCTLAAQTTGTATIAGAVTDATGSVVPAARVTVTNTATGVVAFLMG